MANVHTKEHVFAIVKNPRTGELERREIVSRSQDYKIRDRIKSNIEQSIRHKKRLEGK